MNFVLPSECNRDDVTDFYGEIAAGGGECIGIGNYGNYDLWLTGMKNRHAGKNLSEGYVREDFYLCYEDGKLVGVFSLKFELTEFLLELAGRLGFERVLCVCDEDNYASERVILKRGRA